MIVVIQRVISAELLVDNKFYSKIGTGLVVLVAVSKHDTQEDINWIANKLVNLRIFSDQNNQMNLSVCDLDGDIMIVSQFTLYGSTKKGNRPSYINAAKGDFAKKMYNSFIKELQKYLNKNIKTGKFGSNMSIEFENVGPVTIIIDSKNKI